jgi:hypothetical protein
MINKKKTEQEIKNEPHSEFETSTGNNFEDAAKELPTSGELPDPEEMKLYETRKKEEQTHKGKSLGSGNADDHTGYDYRGNK